MTKHRTPVLAKQKKGKKMNTKAFFYQHTQLSNNGYEIPKSRVHLLLLYFSTYLLF